MSYYAHEDEIQKDFNVVWGAIHKYGFEPTDDNFQIGCIGLLKASRKFDYSKNFKFTTFAYRCIANEIYMYYRSKSRTFMENNSVSLNELIADGQNVAEDYHETFEIESDLKSIVYQAIDRTCKDEKNRAIFYDVCTKRMNGVTITQSEIAKQYEMSVTKVSRHFRQINQEIKKMLNGSVN